MECGGLLQSPAPIHGDVYWTNHDEVISDIVGDYQLAGLSARCIQNDPITTIFYPESSPKKLEKVLDVLGREVNHTTNQILFYIYDDGSVEKKFIVD